MDIIREVSSLIYNSRQEFEKSMKGNLVNDTLSEIITKSIPIASEEEENKVNNPKFRESLNKLLTPVSQDLVNGFHKVTSFNSGDFMNQTISTISESVSLEADYRQEKLFNDFALGRINQYDNAAVAQAVGDTFQNTKSFENENVALRFAQNMNNVFSTEDANDIVERIKNDVKDAVEEAETKNTLTEGATKQILDYKKEIAPPDDQYQDPNNPDPGTDESVQDTQGAPMDPNGADPMAGANPNAVDGGDQTNLGGDPANNDGAGDPGQVYEDGAPGGDPNAAAGGADPNAGAGADPNAGGADPNAGGADPMNDPAGTGDPNAPAGDPNDPMAGGAGGDPNDPMAGGGDPNDPMAGGDPNAAGGDMGGADPMAGGDMGGAGAPPVTATPAGNSGGITININGAELGKAKENAPIWNPLRLAQHRIPLHPRTFNAMRLPNKNILASECINAGSYEVAKEFGIRFDGIKLNIDHDTNLTQKQRDTLKDKLSRYETIACEAFEQAQYLDGRLEELGIAHDALLKTTENTIFIANNIIKRFLTKTKFISPRPHPYVSKENYIDNAFDILQLRKALSKMSNPPNEMVKDCMARENLFYHNMERCDDEELKKEAYAITDLTKLNFQKAISPNFITDYNIKAWEINVGNKDAAKNMHEEVVNRTKKQFEDLWMRELNEDEMAIIEAAVNNTDVTEICPTPYEKFIVHMGRESLNIADNQAINSAKLAGSAKNIEWKARLFTTIFKSAEALGLIDENDVNAFDDFTRSFGL